MSSPRVPPRTAPRRISVGKRSPLPSSPFTAYTAPESQTETQDYARLYARELLRPDHELELNRVNKRHNEQINTLKKTLVGHGGYEAGDLIARYKEESNSVLDAKEMEIKLERSLRKAFVLVVASLVIFLLVRELFPGMISEALAILVLTILGIMIARYQELMYLATGQVN